MSKKFLKYQFALAETKESDMTDGLRTRVEETIFSNEDYGVDGYGLSTDDEIAFCGKITAGTKQECKARYVLLKAAAKALIPRCKKTKDLVVGTGDILW